MTLFIHKLFKHIAGIHWTFAAIYLIASKANRERTMGESGWGAYHRCMSTSMGSGDVAHTLAREHYENFPVAGWLCPPHLRAPIAAIYAFARTADDIADEGEASAEARLTDLAAYRVQLWRAAAQQHCTEPRWADVFAHLSRAIERHALPVALLDALLQAFEQDVRHTASGHRYADHAELLAYCALSANPVGRLLLHLYGICDAPSLAHSDAICSGLQLINFWQDFSRDIPRARHYAPRDALAAHGLSYDDLEVAVASGCARAPTESERAFVAALRGQAQALLHQGSPLAKRIAGRAGWELRLVVQGGLRIAQRIAENGDASLQRRVAIRKRDAPGLLWRAVWM
jgi:hydroxysqualene synthase